jgi:hypothetical protein
MTWFDPQKRALEALEHAEEDLVRFMASGPYAMELTQRIVRYLGSLWQTETNDGRDPAETKGIKTAMEQLRVLGEKAQPPKQREGIYDGND